MEVALKKTNNGYTLQTLEGQYIFFYTMSCDGKAYCQHNNLQIVKVIDLRS